MIDILEMRKGGEYEVAKKLGISLDDFSKKVHIRYFVEQITEISDRAETISERASVAAIKRRI